MANKSFFGKITDKYPFLRTSLVWGLGLVSMILVADFAGRQLDAYDRNIGAVLPYFVVLFGTALGIKYIGERPVFYSALTGITVGVTLAFLGLLSELLGFSGIYLESFARFGWVAILQSLIMGTIGAVAGWVMTRGRTPIAIEMPTKKETEAAKKLGQELAPRIITPVSQMPGNLETNLALLEQLEKDPATLMTDKERAKLARTPKKK